MANVNVTPDRDAVVSEVEIAAPPDRVFEALVNREQVSQWSNSDAYQLVHWELEPRTGGKWRSTSREKTSSKIFDHWGEIVEVDRPRILAYTWFANWHADQSHPTMVRWELTPTASGTSLKVTHSGLAALPGACEGYSQGWPGLLEAVRTFVERKKGARA
jgi:uncharacterized protein YndB with AHSA1/START domain